VRLFHEEYIQDPARLDLQHIYITQNPDTRETVLESGALVCQFGEFVFNKMADHIQIYFA